IFGIDEAKKNSTLAVMDHVLSAAVRLLHPFMPHITEELWSLLGFGTESIQFAPMPERIPMGQVNRKLVAEIYEAVQAGRNLRAEAGIPSNQKVRFTYWFDENSRPEIPTIARLLNAELGEGTNENDLPGTPIAITPLGRLALRIQVDPAAERERLD